jgi:SWI/SNF-related matrix-associated actin-dependent regulator 1 of chromatin subfamily A
MYSVASEIKEIKQKGILRKIDKEKLESLLVKDGELFEKWDSLKHPIKKIWKRNGFTNQMELHRILKKHVMIRRTKEEVDLQLPPKTYANVDLKIDNWQVYKQAEDNFIQYIKESFDAKAEKQLDANLHPEELDLDEKLDAISRAPALAMIQALKMLAAEGKMKQVIEWVKDFLDTDEKLIIFAINKVIVQTLMDAFPFAVKIDGSTTKAKRNEAVKSFQNDEKCRLFIGNMKAAGIGLTLTAASKVAIVQFPWNPGELVQAEDRAHRITQKEKVTIYKFVAKDTIEERIVQLLKNKQIEIDKIIDGTNVNMNTDLVKLLINSYK